MSSAPAKNEQFRALQTAKHRLEYLTSNDWALIGDKSQVLTFNKEDGVIQAGMRPRHLFFILSGKARIESAPNVKLAEVSQGDICGEMSFLEDSVASARVVAESSVETLAIEWTALQRLFELYPHLGSRFFRSPALNLSRRLRQQLNRSYLESWSSAQRFSAALKQGLPLYNAIADGTCSSRGTSPAT